MTDVIKPDIPKLRKYVEWVEEQELLPLVDRQWEQGFYVWTPQDGAGMRRAHYVRGCQGCQVCTARSCGTVFCVAGKVQFDETGSEDVDTAEPYAQRALGLTEQDTDSLFADSNDAADIRRIAEGIAGERL